MVFRAALLLLLFLITVNTQSPTEAGAGTEAGDGAEAGATTQAGATPQPGVDTNQTGATTQSGVVSNQTVDTEQPGAESNQTGATTQSGAESNQTGATTADGVNLTTTPEPVTDGVGEATGTADPEAGSESGAQSEAGPRDGEDQMPPEYRSHHRSDVKYKDTVDCGEFTSPKMRIQLEGKASVVYARENYECRADRFGDVYTLTDIWENPECSKIIKKEKGLKMYSIELVVQFLPDIRRVSDPIYIITCNYEPSASNDVLASTKIVTEGVLPRKVSRYHNVLNDTEVRGVLVVQNKNGENITESHLGMYVRLQALLNKVEPPSEDKTSTTSDPLAGEFGFEEPEKNETGVEAGEKPDHSYRLVDCVAESEGREYEILRRGCGTGDVIPRNRGFFTTRMEGRHTVRSTSVYFSAFQIPGSTDGELTFRCTFIICTQNAEYCDGASCPDSEYFPEENLRKKRETAELAGDRVRRDLEVTEDQPVLRRLESVPLSVNQETSSWLARQGDNNKRTKQEDSDPELPAIYDAIPEDLYAEENTFVNPYSRSWDRDTSGRQQTRGGDRDLEGGNRVRQKPGTLSDHQPNLTRQTVDKDTQWITIGPVIGLSCLCGILLITFLCTLCFYRKVVKDLRGLKVRASDVKWYYPPIGPASHGASGRLGQFPSAVYSVPKPYQPPKYNEHWKPHDARDREEYMYYTGQNC